MPRYIVTLTNDEIQELKAIIQKGGKGYRIKHAQILLKLDQKPENKAWTYDRIKDAYGAARSTIAGIAQLSMLQLRDIKHNMKNNLISILAYAENKEYEKMTGFIEEIMGEGGMVIASISNSGNIVIDSLIGYWYVTAQNKKIIFKTDICIPMIMPFKGADLSLILGNLLENAVEAAEKVEENRYINVKMKFDKNNLLLIVDNSYKGKLLKTRDNRLKSTKSDAENHGVGLASVYRAVAKYHGSVVIEDSEPGKFKIRIVLYSNVQE